MKKIPGIIIFLFVCSALWSEEVLLRYQSAGSEPLRFRFVSELDGQYVSPAEIQTTSQKLSGFFEDAYSGMSFLKRPLIQRSYTLEKYILNGENQEVREAFANLMSYRYEQDPVLGMVAKIEYPKFDPSDVMEMVIQFPQKPVKVGETFPVKWVTYMGPKQGEKFDPTPLQGGFRLVGVAKGMARLQGRLEARTPVPDGVKMIGRVAVKAEMIFDLEKGFFREGQSIQEVAWESRTELARIFARQAKDGERLGYKVQFKYRFKLDEDAR